MNLLLDSDTYLWWLVDHPKLSRPAREAIAEPRSVVYVSAISLWELTLKSSLDQLDLGGCDLVAEIVENDFLELPVSARHAARAGFLPRLHDDPFDRVLIAQAQLEGLTCVTGDPAFRAYDVLTVW